MFSTLLVCFRVSLYGLDSSSTFFMNLYRSDKQRELWVVKAVKGAILIYGSNLSLRLMNVIDFFVAFYRMSFKNALNCCGSVHSTLQRIIFFLSVYFQSESLTS